MKNKLYYVLLGLVVCFSFMNSVFAEGITISAATDNTEVVKGEKALITIKLTASEAIANCSFKIESDETIVFDSIASANTWSPSGSVGDGFLVTSPSGESSFDVPNNKGISQLSYTVNGNGKVTIKTEQCVSAVGEKVYTYDDVVVNLTTIETAEDTALSSISVTNGTMEPATITTSDIGYFITLDSPKFGLTMVASNPDYNDDIVVTDEQGNVITDLNNITYSDPSNYGSMILDVSVNGGKSYTLVVLYENKELDNSLESITINGDKLNLIAGQYDYKYTVSKDTTDIVVAAVIKDSENFKFGSSSNAPDTFTISNTVDIIIQVEPKDSSSGGDAVTYTVEVTKESGSSSGNTSSGNNGNAGNKPSGNTGSSGTGSSNNGSQNTNKNPQTSDIPMFLMAFILVASLIGSIVLYRKNLESYK